MDDKNPIRRAAEVVGSKSALAERLGVSKGAVWQWEHERNVPAERCPEIEKATGGAVTCEELRPDVDWGYLRQSGREPADSISGGTVVKPLKAGETVPR